MNYKKAIIFIVLDLVTLLAAILLFAYFGLSHLFMLFLGGLFLVLALYDLRSGELSALFSAFLGFPEGDEFKRFQWAPILLSTLLLAVSLPALLEHGLVNSGQRWAMQQEGQFMRLLIPAVSAGALVIAMAVFTVIKGLKK